MYTVKLIFSLVFLIPAFFIKPTNINTRLIRIESIGVVAPLQISFSKTALKNGVVLDGNSLEGNNWVIYGHRFSRLGKDTSFLYLDKVKEGDEIKVVISGKEYIYIVESILEVEPDQLWTIGQGGERTLTLVTCTPVLYPTKRLVVISILKR